MKTEVLTEKDYQVSESLRALGIKDINNGVCTGTKWFETSGELIESYASADGALIGKVKQGTADDYEKVAQLASEAFISWRMVPAPKRGEIVRLIGDELRKHKAALGKLVSYETGKIYQEGLGE